MASRKHPDTDPKKQLADIVNDTVKHGGSIVIPSFAGRATDLIYLFKQMEDEKLIGHYPIVLDSTG